MNNLRYLNRPPRDNERLTNMILYGFAMFAVVVSFIAYFLV